VISELPAGRVAEAVHPEGSSGMRPARVKFVLFVLLVAAIAPFFVGLDTSSIWDANEAFYVETPREMIERADYVSPTFNYEPRFNKPVLSYWIVAGFYRLFGVSVGVQRVPIALGAIGLILAASFLAGAGAQRAFRRLDSGSALTEAGSAAAWAALGLAVSPRLLMFARRIFIDIYISMFMALTLLFFALAERYPARRRLYLLLMYVSIGLGILTKGPVAAALPGLVFAVYLVMHREPRRIGELMIPLGTAVILAIVVPWYAAVYQRHGWSYITSFFIGENVGRYTEGVGFRSSRGPFFYLPVVLSDSFPWSLFLIPAAAAWIRDWRRRPEDRDAGFRIRTLLWLWITVIVGFFSFSASKQDLYIFPIVPAVAALAGVQIACVLSVRGESAPGLRATVGAIGIVLAVLGGSLVYFFLGAGRLYALSGTTALGVIAMGGGVAAVALALRSRSTAALVTVAATMIALNWTFVLRVLPSFEAYKPVPALAAAIEQRATAADVIATYDVAVPSLVYYLRRHVNVFFEREPFLQAFRAGGTVYAIVTRDTYDSLAPAIGIPTCALASRPTFDVKLKNILALQPLPELVVITNRCG
jgi:4-amino-4-deoxy-L-arabinose transferase-like glycosyltransferase